jgi:peptidoglycan/LPS O-acetylase OafA/YrhL
MVEKETGRLAELDALRGLAAVAVILFHYLSRYPEMSPIGQATAFRFPWGRFGVEIFFGISGFVIFMTLRRTERASDFLVSRFARLFPAYWAAIVVTTATVHLFGAHYLYVSNPVLITNFSMLQGHWGIEMVDGAYWSLSVELGFYACMLALWRLRLLDRIEWALGCWIGLKLLWWAFPGLSWRLGYLLIIEYIPFFAIGVAAYRVWCAERRWIQQLPLLILAYSSVLLIDPWQMAWVFPVSLACFIAISMNWLGFLRHAALLWLGSISYALYLIHQYAGFAIMDGLHSVGISGLVAAMITAMVILALAWLISRYIERPALTKIRQYWRNRQILISQRTTEPASR